EILTKEWTSPLNFVRYKCLLVLLSSCCGINLILIHQEYEKNLLQKMRYINKPSSLAKKNITGIVATEA
ncbi:hypothetical protein ACT6KL_004876, partial [Escherichia coli]